ncbi:hypothetical protein EKH55_5330 [Sinorhizobium alkalisoli]|nr:hypothetical protein EKH55_5330 [Sinorhizobium alkalisoli]
MILRRRKIALMRIKPGRSNYLSRPGESTSIGHPGEIWTTRPFKLRN